MLRDLVLQNRSFRRFYEDAAVSQATLKELVDLARLTPSAANLQPLKYVLSFTAEKNALIFPLLAWAGYLRDWPGPGPGERPAAYIIILGDRQISKHFGCDHGIAAQTILLGAAEKGLGGCMIGSVERTELLRVLGLSAQHYEVLLVIAVGKPKEKVVLDPVGESGDIKYRRDSDGIHHVPKRSLNDILLA
jgi:nitroreductase